MNSIDLSDYSQIISSFTTAHAITSSCCYVISRHKDTFWCALFNQFVLFCCLHVCACFSYGSNFLPTYIQWMVESSDLMQLVSVFSSSLLCCGCDHWPVTHAAAQWRTATWWRL